MVYSKRLESGQSYTGSPRAVSLEGQRMEARIRFADVDTARTNRMSFAVQSLDSFCRPLFHRCQKLCAGSRLCNSPPIRLSLRPPWKLLPPSRGAETAPPTCRLNTSLVDPYTTTCSPPTPPTSAPTTIDAWFGNSRVLHVRSRIETAHSTALGAVCSWFVRLRHSHARPRT